MGCGHPTNRLCLCCWNTYNLGAKKCFCLQSAANQSSNWRWKFPFEKNIAVTKPAPHCLLVPTNNVTLLGSLNWVKKFFMCFQHSCFERNKSFKAADAIVKQLFFPPEHMGCMFSLTTDTYLMENKDKWMFVLSSASQTLFKPNRAVLLTCRSSALLCSSK